MEKVIIHEEVQEGEICLQWIEENGRQSYQFAWKSADGNFRRGKPKIPSIEVVFILFAKATKKGWLGQPERGEFYAAWLRRKLK